MSDRLAWWQEGRFGMFIHWGIYAVPGRGEWVMYHEGWSNEEYARFADDFTAKHYSPKDWVALAQDAGMKYMVLTTRHHDGYCLFDSKTTDFSAPNTAPGRDLVAEYADACHAAGMKTGFYYSLEDWRFPHQLPHKPIHEDMSVYEPMVEQAHAQVHELMTNYGQVDLLWYDGGFPAEIWRPVELNAMVRELQPDIIINNRAGSPEDYCTPEQRVAVQDRPWESCMTMNDIWGYTPDEKDYKSVYEIEKILISATSQGGNLLMNVGPDPEGRIPRPAVDRLRAVGAWLRTNGEAVYGAGPSVLKTHSLGPTSRVGNKQYIFVKNWPGSTIRFAWCGNNVLSARVLATGDEARIEQDGQIVWLHDMPQYAPDPNFSVIEITVEGEPKLPDVQYT